jgi:hypothetical protein
MKTKLCALLVFLSSISLLKAQALLSVDFDGVYYNVTQSGFTGIFVPVSNTYSTTIGSYSFDFLGAGGSDGNSWHNDAVPSDTYQPLYKDYLSVNGWNGYTLTLGGLAADTTYSLTLWFSENTGYDLNDSVTGSYSSYAVPSSANLTDNAFTTDITTNGSGQIVGTFTPSGYGTGGLAGLQLSAISVPEPSTVVSIGLGLVFLAFRLRPRMVYCRIRNFRN